jgi:hypothetical protein
MLSITLLYLIPFDVFASLLWEISFGSRRQRTSSNLVIVIILIGIQSGFTGWSFGRNSEHYKKQNKLALINLLINFIDIFVFLNAIFFWIATVYDLATKFF